MIVVSNTSPLTNLSAIGQFHLLQKLYHQLHIADGVWDELNAFGRQWPGRSEVASAGWIKRYTPQNRSLIITLENELDRGESETIALAIEQNADIVLIDEKEGRREAKRHGLKTTGVLGILLQAKSKGHIDTIQPHLDSLRQQAGFYLADTLYNQVLVIAKEHF